MKAKTKRQTKFETMSQAELRAFIDICHESRTYDAQFDKACFVFNNRFR
jgi:hypothetical protein